MPAGASATPPAAPDERPDALQQRAPEAAAQPSAWATLNPELFPVAEELESAVEFWSTISTGYSNDVVLLHDDRHLHVIYAALDFSELQNSELSEIRKRRVRRDRIRKAKEKYRSILTSSAAGKVSKAYPNDQARIEELFDRVP
ncbi:MAG: hypothetical protein AAGN66_28120, partial [Acidobacteriota bacterium]